MPLQDVGCLDLPFAKGLIARRLLEGRGNVNSLSSQEDEVPGYKLKEKEGESPATVRFSSSRMGGRILKSKLGLVPLGTPKQGKPLPAWK
jgi:hypothetical protein